MASSSASTTPPITAPPATASPATGDGEGGSSSNSAPIVAGTVSAVAGAALIGLGVIFMRRRSAARKKERDSAAPLSSGGGGGGTDDFERQEETQGDVRHLTSAAVAGGSNGGFDEQGGVSHGDVEFGAERGGLFAKTDSNKKKNSRGGREAEDRSLTASISTDGVPTAERAALATSFGALGGENSSAWSDQRRNNGRFVAGTRDSSEGGTKKQGSGDVGIRKAALEAAQELALHCQIPGVR